MEQKDLKFLKTAGMLTDDDIPNMTLHDRLEQFNQMMASEAQINFKSGRKLAEGDTLVDWDELPKDIRHRVKMYWQKLQTPKYKRWTYQKKIKKLSEKFNLKIVDE